MPGKTSRCCRRAHAGKVQNHERNTKLHLAKQNSLRLQARCARVNPARVALPDVDTERLSCAKPALSGAQAFWLQHCRAINTFRPTCIRLISLIRLCVTPCLAETAAAPFLKIPAQTRRGQACPERNTLEKPRMRLQGFSLERDCADNDDAGCV